MSKLTDRQLVVELRRSWLLPAGRRHELDKQAADRIELLVKELEELRRR